MRAGELVDSIFGVSHKSGQALHIGGIANESDDISPLKVLAHRVRLNKTTNGLTNGLTNGH